MDNNQPEGATDHKLSAVIAHHVYQVEADEASNSVLRLFAN